MSDTALSVREYDTTDLAPRFVVSLDQMVDQLAQLEQFKLRIMRPGVDYGEIPGTHKPSLLKPGAEKLAMAFGLAPTFESVTCIEDWERGFFHYDERCILTNKRSGMVVASANGSANSKETRYRWRVTGGCTDCGKPLKYKRDTGAWCPRDKGGCGKNYDPGKAPKQEQVENSEPYELVNTIKKMAQKRALVAAVLIATGGSGTWTQDVEDMDAAEVIDVQPRTVVQEQPRQPSQLRPAARSVGTDSKCARCDKMVESASLLRDSQAKFQEPLCVQHFNERVGSGGD